MTTGRVATAGRVAASGRQPATGRVASTRIWTPALLGGYWLRPSLAASGPDTSITLVSGKLSSATVGGGKSLTQATASKRPVYDVSSPLNGYAAYLTDVANAIELSSSTGGIAGSAAHSMWAVVSMTANSSYTGIFTFGPVGSSSTLGHYWGGGPGFITPVYAVGDTGTHLLVVSFDGVTKTLSVDGEYLLDTYSATGAAAAYNITDASFGIKPSFDPTVATAAIRTSGWPTQAMSAANNTYLQRWAATTFGLTKNRLLLCAGDSQTAGYLATVSPLNWPSRIVSQGPLSAHAYDINWAGGTPYPALAVAGWETTDLLATYVSGTVNRASAMRDGPGLIVTLWIGTNDIYLSHRSPATIYARVSTMVAAMRAVGIYVIVITPLPREDSAPAWYETDRQALRALILANSAGADAVADIGGIAALQTPSSTTNYQADKVHLNANAVDTIVCPFLAPYIAAAG